MNMSKCSLTKNNNNIIGIQPKPLRWPPKKHDEGGKKASSLSTCVCLNSFSKAAQRRKKNLGSTGQDRTAHSKSSSLLPHWANTRARMWSASMPHSVPLAECPQEENSAYRRVPKRTVVIDHLITIQFFRSLQMSINIHKQNGASNAGNRSPPRYPPVLPAANGFRGTAHTIPTGNAFQLLGGWKTWSWGLFVSQNH